MAEGIRVGGTKCTLIYSANLVEYAVFSRPSGVPDDWRLWRIEWYRPEEPYAFREMAIWLPRNADIIKLEEALCG